MGCCEAREHLPRVPKERRSISLGQLSLQTISEYHPVQKVFDQQSHSLLEYVHSIMDSAPWNPVYTEDWLEMHTLQHSVYRENLQVNRVCVKFAEQLDAGLVFEILNDPKRRLGWDSTLAQMDIEGDLKTSFTTYRVLSGFGIKRDFHEKKFVGSTEGALVSMAYSTEGKETTITRGQTYFSYTGIVTVKDMTHVILVNQTDTQLPTQTFTKLAAVRLKAWSKTFFKQVIKVHSNNEGA